MLDLSVIGYIEWCISIMNMRPEEAVERASRKLERQTGKPLSFDEMTHILNNYYRCNPYRKTY